jgi:hypothetical protein
VIRSIGTVIVVVLFGFQVAMLAGSAYYLLAAASGAMAHEPGLVCARFDRLSETRFAAITGRC